MLDDFDAILAALPPPPQWSLETLAGVLRGSTGSVTVEREEVDSQVHRFLLASGFQVTVSRTGRTVVCVHSPSLDLSQGTALARIAQEYARAHEVSLESYFFHDTNAAMFGFGALENAAQVSEGFPSVS